MERDPHTPHSGKVETGFSSNMAKHVSLPAKVLSFGDSLTSVSAHAHISKNTVKR
jgi:hypothetical protein